MRIQIILIGALTLATGLNAQQPGPPPFGRGGFGGGARFLGAEPGRPGRVVKNAPYSADVVTETTQALPDGNRIRQTSTSRVYRDSEGRTRREQSLNGLSSLVPNSNLPQVVFITDPVAATTYALNAKDRTAAKSAWHGGGRGPGGPPPDGNGPNAMGRRGSRPQADSATPRPPDGGSPGAAMRRNVKTESLGRQTIEGVPADGTRSTMTIAAGAIGNEQPISVVTETWYSPELQAVVLSKHSDPRSGETVTRLMNVSRTEPPRTLFDVPADYKVTELARPRSNKQ